MTPPFSGRIRAILFDLDGTLVDTAADLAGAANATLERLGLPPRSLEEVTSFVGHGVRRLVEDVLGRTDPALVDRALEIFRPHYLNHCADASRPYPGVEEGLERLARTHSLAVVTNKPLAPTMRLLELLGLQGRFSSFIGGDSLPQRKPDPAPLFEALRRLDVPPSEALMFGDSPGDMAAARSAGVKAWGAVYGYRPAKELEESGAERLIGSFDELVSLIKNGAKKQ